EYASYSLQIKAEVAGDTTFTIDNTNATTVLDNVSDFGGSPSTNGAAGAGNDLLSASNAQNALASVTSAIGTKDSYRAKLGYWMNRLSAAVTVLDIQSENLSAAESRISDVDVATEMAAMTRNQVLAQAGIAMLGQANMMPQMALQLLG
ncbi:MAG: flagellin, partial [Phycisphaerae bacterium]|nr:flagellin [Phycisphaerae bacterium]